MARVGLNRAIRYLLSEWLFRPGEEEVMVGNIRYAVYYQEGFFVLNKDNVRDATFTYFIAGDEKRENKGKDLFRVFGFDMSPSGSALVHFYNPYHTYRLGKRKYPTVLVVLRDIKVNGRIKNIAKSVFLDNLGEYHFLYVSELPVSKRREVRETRLYRIVEEEERVSSSEIRITKKIELIGRFPTYMEGDFEMFSWDFERKRKIEKIKKIREKERSLLYI